MHMVEVKTKCETHGDRMTFQYGSREPKCPVCIEEQAEARRLEYVREEQVRRREQLELDAKNAVPPRYIGSRLADFDDSVTLKVKAWLAGCREKSGSLIILGPVGTGKTHLSTAITHALITNGPGAKYVSQANYLRQIRQTWDNKSERSEESVISAYVKPRVLVLDDIGAARGNDNDALRVGELISERYDALKPSVFVSNLTPSELRAVVGDRSYDRMRDNAVQLVLNGETRRKAA